MERRTFLKALGALITAPAAVMGLKRQKSVDERISILHSPSPTDLLEISKEWKKGRARKGDRVLGIGPLKEIVVNPNHPAKLVWWDEVEGRRKEKDLIPG